MNLASIIDQHGEESAAVVSRGRITTYGDLRVQVGALRRLGESIGLASRMSPLKIQWNLVNGNTIAYRAVVLDLSLIPAGKYELTIQTSSAVSTRVVELR